MALAGGKARAFRHLCPVVPSNGRAFEAGTTRIRAIKSVFGSLVKKRFLSGTRVKLLGRLYPICRGGRDGPFLLILR